MKLDARVPAGPLAEKWTKFKANARLVNPSNKRKYEVIVVGTGLAGASAAASLAELGYRVKSLFPRQSAAGALDCGARGNQRSQELSK